MNLSGQTYSLDSIVDQNVSLNTDVNTFKIPNPNSAVFKSFASGSSIGVVDSYIINQFGTWLMFYDDNQTPYYYLVKPAEINTAVLKQQGVLTEKEKSDAEAEKNMSFVDKLKTEVLAASKIFLIALAIIVLLFIIYEIYAHTKKQ